MHALTSALLLFGLAATGACSGSATMLEPVFEACASDENWRTFDDYESTGRLQTDPSVTPQWIVPTMSTSYAAAAPPILQWQPSAALAGTLDGDATCPQFQPASLGKLRPLHLPAVSGTVYDLHLSVDGQDSYRVITTRQRTGLPANVFAAWAGKTVTMTLYEAKMLMNQVTLGPAQAPVLTLQVTP